MPRHEIVNKLGMTQDKFAFIWRYFHTYLPDEYDKDDDLSGRDEAEERESVKQVLEHVQQEKINKEGEKRESAKSQGGEQEDMRTEEDRSVRESCFTSQKS